MTVFVVKVRIPQNISEFFDCAVRLDEVFRGTYAEPKFIFLDKRENFLIGDCVHAPDNEKLLAVFHELRYILAEQAERRIRDDHIRLFEERYALFGAEVSVAFKRADFPFGLIGHAVPVRIAVIDVGGSLSLALVAEADELFQAQGLEESNEIGNELGGLFLVQSSALEEHGIVAVAIDDLV